MAQWDLCVVTARVESLGRDHIDVARAALAGGCRVVQFRDKAMNTRDLLATAQELRELTRAREARLIINDRVDIALAAGADGVHVGNEDMPVAVARRLMGDAAIVGASVATAAEAEAAAMDGASYVSAGSVFRTGSKPDAGEPIGLEPVRRIKAAVAVPVLAIGGIDRDNVGAVIGAGADGVAVIAAVAEAADMVAATEDLRRHIAEARSSSDH